MKRVQPRSGSVFGHSSYWSCWDWLQCQAVYVALMYLFNPGLPQRGEAHLSTRRPATKGTFRPDPGSTHIRNSGKGRMLQAQHNVSFIPRVEAGRSQPNCELLFCEPAWPDGRPAGRAGSSQAARSPESRPGHRRPCASFSGPVAEESRQNLEASDPHSCLPAHAATWPSPSWARASLAHLWDGAGRGGVTRSP